MIFPISEKSIARHVMINLHNRIRCYVPIIDRFLVWILVVCIW